MIQCNKNDPKLSNSKKKGWEINVQSITEPRENFKYMCKRSLQGRMEKVGKQKLLEEIMAKNVPNLIKTINSHVQEV